MVSKIIQKTFTQLVLSLVVSILYMQIRPVQQYTLAWPFAFLSSWFVLWAWIAYLRLDRLNIFEVTDMYKKQIEKTHSSHEEKYMAPRSPSFFNYITTPIQSMQSDPEATPGEQLKVKIYSNGICAILFFILTCVF